MPAPLEREATSAAGSEQGASPKAEQSAVQRSAGLRLPKPARLPSEAVAVADESRLHRDQSGIGLKVDPQLIASKRPSLPPTVARFGRYDVIGRVAVGGMAEIFLSRETLPGGALRRCALKVLKRGVEGRSPAHEQPARTAEDERYFEELFWRECRTAVQLSHPNICHVYEVGKSADRFFIAMEWIDGRPLSEVLAKLAEQNELMPPGMAVGIAAQVASALHYAHTARDARNQPLNVIHRDVNPQNIMLRHDGSVKLVDFGVAHISEAEQDSRADTVKGKPAYMAPEQLQGKNVDGRVDVFALGVCLYEMLTGERLNKRASIRETLVAVLRETPGSLQDKLPGTPAALDTVVQRALAKQPQDRFASAGDFQAALEGYLADCGEVGSAREVGRLMERLYPDAKHALPKLDTSASVISYLTEGSVVESLKQVLPVGGLSRRWLVLAALLGTALLGTALLSGLLWPGAKPTPAVISNVSTAPQVQSPSALPPPTDTLAEQPASSPPTPAIQLPPPAVHRAPAPKTKAPPRADNRPKRRTRSPGFVADPGF